MKIFNSISSKVSILYILLAIINIAFFTVIIFENQVDLIADNTRLQARELADTVISALKRFSTEVSSDGIFRAKSDREMVEQIDSIIRPLVKDYIIFSESGEVFLKSSPDVSMTDTYVRDGMRAIANKDFAGKDYFLKFNEKANEIYFYVPLNEYRLKGSVLSMKYRMKDIGNRLRELYSLVSVMVVVILAFHVIFAVVLFRLIVSPIQSLSRGSKEIAEGNLNARVNIDRKDELGALGSAFNKMAESIKEKIHTLEEQMNIISEARDKIEEMAITDELTGLYNRRYLFDRLEHEIANAIRYNNPLGFIMIDIDHFKEFNDTHGHYVGDKVLKEVADAIKGSCRSMDVVARYGGEEISVIAPHLGIEELSVVAERIRQDIENKQIEGPDGITLSVAVSLGAASFDSTRLKKMDSMDDLVNAADESLYRAKQNGRNRTEIYRED